MLTWAGRLDLRLVLFGVRVEEIRRRVLATLDLALEGVQTLDILFLERTGRAARCAHVQVGGQLPPLLVLIHLVGDRGRRRLRKLHTVLQEFPHGLFSCVIVTSNSGRIQAYLCKAANLFDGHVESEEI